MRIIQTTTEKGRKEKGKGRKEGSIKRWLKYMTWIKPPRGEKRKFITYILFVL